MSVRVLGWDCVSLTPIGIAPGIHEWMEDSWHYNLRLNVILGKFKLGVSHGMEPQAYRK
jgi:hypothetical protein